ncbi:MAG: hypothetical protein LUG83_01340 [Lachnospiraceae bacterium]|nr:hypothetical protein [Lachnospiraceae bacterium]
MTRLRKRWEKTDKNSIIELMYLAVLGLYLLKLSFDTTMFYIPWPENYEIILFIITCCVVMLKIGYSEKCRGMRWLFCVITGIAFGISWWHTEYNYLFLLYIPVLIAGAYDVNYKKLLSVSFWINFVTLALAFTGSCAGVISDLSYEAETGFRHSFGIVYTTDFAARVFYLIIIGWVLFDNIHIIIELLLTAFCTWFIYYYCQGKCSAITLLLFMAVIIYEYITRNGGLLKKLPIQILDYLIVWAAPICAGTIIYLSLRYEESTKWIVELNQILTNRLSLSKAAINEYGFTFFGTAFEQQGAGGSTAYNFSYNFVDPSYILTMLRYGAIVFIIILTLTVYMSRRALKNNNRRLLIALMLVSVHSIVEHHMPEINYNIFLILPFTTITLQEKSTRSSIRFKNYSWKSLAVKAMGCIVFIMFVPFVMRYIKTIVNLTNTDSIHFIKWVLIIFTAAAVFGYIIVKIFGYSAAHTNLLGVKIIVIMIPIIIICILMCRGCRILQMGKDEYIVTIENEKTIIEKIMKNCGDDITLYVDDIPAIYKGEIKNVSDMILPVEACDKIKDDVLLITRMDKELNNLLKSGYYFGELSDTHGVYTNSENAVKALEDMGISMTDYYSVLCEIDMQLMADANGLEMTEDGGLLLSGSEKSIYHGPWISLSEGRYTIKFDLNLLSCEGEALGFIRISSDSGETVWKRMDISIEDFDENGHVVLNVEMGFWCDVANTEFIIIANDGTELAINSIEYSKVSN